MSGSRGGADRDAIPGEKGTPSSRDRPGSAVAAAQHCSAWFTVAKPKHRVWEGAGVVPIFRAAVDPFLPHRPADTLTQETILPPPKPASKEP